MEASPRPLESSTSLVLGTCCSASAVFAVHCCQDGDPPPFRLNYEPFS